jgi:hypothetical protein
MLAAGCTSIHRLDSTKYDVITVPQGIKEPHKLEGVDQRISRGEPVIFKVAEGERMPFKLTMDLPMGKLEKSDYQFAFNHDTYFLLSKKAGFQLSPDGQRWASIASPKSMAKLFGFKHGEVAFGFTTSTNENPFMNLEIKVK